MPDLSAYQEFLLSRKRDLCRIANSTRGEFALSDIEQQAWVTADLLEKRAGCPFDLTFLANQNYLMGCLHNEFVKFSEKTVRYAASIDQDQDSEDGPKANNIINLLHQILPGSDPLQELQSQEEDMHRSTQAAFKISYSEAIAYAMLLKRFMGNGTKLAEYLCIALTTLIVRIDRAIELLKIQPTLFDGIEIIDPDFIAKRNKRPSRRVSEIWISQQIQWEL